MNNESEYFLRHLRREHDAIDEEFSSSRQSLQQRAMDESMHHTAIERLSGLRERLFSHFQEEECEGCLEEAVSRRPGLAREAMAIIAEHRGLIADLDRVIGRLRDASPPIDIAGVEADFEEFAIRFAEHEQREQQAVQSGLNVAE